MDEGVLSRYLAGGVYGIEIVTTIRDTETSVIKATTPIGDRSCSMFVSLFMQRWHICLHML